MNVRILAAIVAAGAVVYACVPRSRSSADVSGLRSAHASELHAARGTPALATVALVGAGTKRVDDASSRKKAKRPPMTEAKVSSSFDVSVRGEVRFALKVVNSGERRVELAFPSGQTHEILVLDASGKEVWRFSEGRLFTQSLQNKVVHGKESVTFEETWSPKGHRGTFTAVATLKSANYPIEERAEFTLP